MTYSFKFEIAGSANYTLAGFLQGNGSSNGQGYADIWFYRQGPPHDTVVAVEVGSSDDESPSQLAVDEAGTLSPGSYRVLASCSASGSEYGRGSGSADGHLNFVLTITP